MIVIATPMGPYNNRIKGIGTVLLCRIYCLIKRIRKIGAAKARLLDRKTTRAMGALETSRLREYKARLMGPRG